MCVCARHCLLNSLQHLVFDVSLSTDHTTFLSACISLLFPSHYGVSAGQQHGGGESLRSAGSSSRSYHETTDPLLAHRETVCCIDVTRPANIALHY